MLPRIWSRPPTPTILLALSATYSIHLTSPHGAGPQVIADAAIPRRKAPISTPAPRLTSAPMTALTLLPRSLTPSGRGVALVIACRGAPATRALLEQTVLATAVPATADSTTLFALTDVQATPSGTTIVRTNVDTHHKCSPIHHRHHRSHSPTYSCYHRHRSVLDCLGPTPSPSPSDSNDTYFSDDIPPSSCGQPLRPSLLRRIRRGEYVNFAHLLPSPPGVDPDRSRYTRRSRSPSPARGGSHTREPQIPLPKITNIDSWLRAWTRYLLAVTHYYPAKAVQMIKYQDRIITAAERFSVDGWYSYDKAFRLKLSHDPSLRWDHLDGDLWAFWCAAQARPFCSRCHRYGHLQAACPVGKSFRPNNKTKDGRIICRAKYNGRSTDKIRSPHPRDRPCGLMDCHNGLSKQRGQAVKST